MFAVMAFLYWWFIWRFPRVLARRLWRSYHVLVIVKFSSGQNTIKCLPFALRSLSSNFRVTQHVYFFPTVGLKSPTQRSMVKHTEHKSVVSRLIACHYKQYCQFKKQTSKKTHSAHYKNTKTRVPGAYCRRSKIVDSPIN